MQVSWIYLPASWKLEDVQAALNVIISVLSGLGIFVFARLCWVRAAANIAEDQSIKLPSLTTLNTIGESFDVLWLLRSKILSSTYFRILAQCIVVACLSATATLSGPIARYSTKRSHLVSQREVNGNLATWLHNSIGYSNVLWNQIQSSLDTAGFPHEQLLDFLPDTSTPWIYHKEEWNSTWHMTCQTTPITEIRLFDTGNCTLPKSLHTEIPGLEAVMPRPYDDGYYYQWWDGYYVNYTIWKDVLMFIVTEKFLDYDNDTGITYSMSVSISSVHLHNLKKQQDDTSSCDFGAGPIEKATYTRMDCDLIRPSHIPDDEYAAYPDCSDIGSIPDAYESNFEARFKQESVSNDPITVITPQDLIRFYQVYHFSKDTQSRKPVKRLLSVSLPNVQLSTAFLAIALLIALLIALGFARYGFFMLRHRKSASLIPEGKLDWMLQSISKDDELNSTRAPKNSSFRHSITLLEAENFYNLSRRERKRAEFEAALYGSGHQAGWGGAEQRRAVGTEVPSYFALCEGPDVHVQPQQYGDNVAQPFFSKAPAVTVEKDGTNW